ncbi:MAG: hypothetical protein GWN61_15450, partial [candidate division Zixibacteria bacterium]|nr:hypothetical protein [Gammaproteobacteria bacterium]NIR65370.1 hypothetical protein [candidate division Zixibacteria bacterium]NIS47327.1 hypothetical protein [candidate division Zixibacteria bacterium]NIV07529.1 hypothetical protein [candidate division Zixibacteria bacterium]NIW40307.1 hypothetical protein [candidate division Zixibacteria bacterium]
HNDQQGEPSSETTSPGTAEGGQPELTHLVNRLPISPGDKLSLSFSINNDSTEKTRKVKLKLEGFMGQNNQFMFIGRDFSLSPSKKEIAPADFDKFIISGEIPFDTPPDIYYGVVHITGDHELKIPVVLNITEKA